MFVWIGLCQPLSFYWRVRAIYLLHVQRVVTPFKLYVLQVVDTKELLGHVFWVGHQNCALV
jgi:hypothetical protein